MREKDIIHERAGFYVFKSRDGFTVARPSASGTHATDDSTYSDLSLAIARCDYLAKRHA